MFIKRKKCYLSNGRSWYNNTGSTASLRRFLFGSYLELFSHILFCISSRTCIFCPCFAIRHNKNTLTVSPVMQHHKSATWMQREQRNPLLEQTTLMNWFILVNQTHTRLPNEWLIWFGSFSKSNTYSTNSEVRFRFFLVNQKYSV